MTFVKSCIAKLCLFSILSVSFLQCGNNNNNEINPIVLLLTVGWLQTRPDGGFGLNFDSSSWSSVEEQINLTDLRGSSTTTNLSSSSLPSKMNLQDTGFFPPIGDQGKYGTCVAWAVGYNMKTYMENRDLNQTTSSSSSQFSPKYLFWSIPDSQKGEGCGGTNFEYALQVVQTKGIATQATVPYTELGDCSYQTVDSWDNEASSYKIKSYRRLDKVDSNGDGIININAIKENIANYNPVVIGAKLGDKFMQWRGSGVLQGDTYNYSGQHAYHAMVVGGYDDSVGPNGSFLVINSWGQRWGNSGTIWVDYNFFKNEFAFASFMATNIPSKPQDENNIVPVYSQADLYGFSLAASINTSNRQLTLSYVVKNTGKTTISSDNNWAIAFILYNANSANDYKVIYYDLFSNKYSDNTCDYDSNLDNAFFCNYNSSVSFASGYGMTRSNDLIASATVPSNLNGTYYSLIVADLMDNISEVNEDNNLLYSSYTTKYENGVPKSVSRSLKTEGNPEGKAYLSYEEMRKVNPNTYTPEELRLLLSQLKNNAYTRLRAKQNKSSKTKTEIIIPKRPVLN
ncbi:MAG: C1 family peptidase [Leptospiraceae bacterium]|nr:C1 family peptidase [Leptospiraceae bacterium]MCP5497422.1 C1 family peptidase [Leptospiraceae bacterium]